MKKVLAISTLAVCLALGFLFSIEKVDASGQEEDGYKLRDLTVKVTMTPTSISAKRMEPRTITIKSSVNGPNTFRFYPDEERGWLAPKYGDLSYDFYTYWSQAGRYTYKGSVTNEYYGPGHHASGTARISY